LLRRNSFGSLAKFTAKRRASFLVKQLGRRSSARLLLKVKIPERLAGVLSCPGLYQDAGSFGSATVSLTISHRRKWHALLSALASL
jgi:hypothetical protein